MNRSRLLVLFFVSLAIGFASIVATSGWTQFPEFRMRPTPKPDIPRTDTPEPDPQTESTQFVEPAAGGSLVKHEPPPVKPLAPADVPTITPSLRLGDRKYIGPIVTAPLSVSADGKTAAFRSLSSVVVWDVPNGREVSRLLPAHSIGRLALSPDGRRLYGGVGGGDSFSFGRGDLRVWDVKTGVELRTRPTSLWALTPDGRTLATMDIIVGTFDRMSPDEEDVPWKSKLTLWNTADFTMLRSFLYTSFVPETIALSADATRIVCGRGPVVTVFDTIGGWPIRKHEYEARQNRQFQSHHHAFTPDGKSVVVADNAHPKCIHLLDVGTGEARQLAASILPFPILGLALTPDGHSLFVGLSDSVMVIQMTEDKRTCLATHLQTGAAEPAASR